MPQHTPSTPKKPRLLSMGMTLDMSGKPGLAEESRHLTDNSLIHWATWLSCTLAITVASYLIASGIPIFSSLVSLIDALLGTLIPCLSEDHALMSSAAIVC